MSAAAAEMPGAPVGNVEIPPASDKSISNAAQKRAPKVTSILAQPDRIILRMNKLLATPGGLSAFLSTFNYTLYLLAYLESKSAPLQVRLYQLLNRTSAVPALNAGPSHIAALGTLLSSTRTTLRLFGLFPLYAGLRSLLQGPKPGQDQVLYSTQFVQVMLYVAFQFLENVGLLTDHGVLPKSYTARYATAPAPLTGKTTGKVYMWAYRAWLGAVLCDVVRLAREAQLERIKRSQRSVTGSTGVSFSQEDEQADAKWWTQVVVPMSWLPVAVQFSSETGIPGFNLGIMGACGALAGLGKTAQLWAETA